MRSRFLIALIGLSLASIGSLASVPAVSADCVVNLSGAPCAGDCIVTTERCRGDCDINLGECARHGDCTVNTKYCNGQCDINAGICGRGG